MVCTKTFDWAIICGDVARKDDTYAGKYVFDLRSLTTQIQYSDFSAFEYKRKKFLHFGPHIKLYLALLLDRILGKLLLVNRKGPPMIFKKIGLH
jgi:hypothetical protein